MISPVQSFRQITTPEEAVESILNGCPVTICRPFGVREQVLDRVVLAPDHTMQFCGPERFQLDWSAVMSPLEAKGEAW
jgi:hypothetical protein